MGQLEHCRLELNRRALGTTATYILLLTFICVRAQVRMEGVSVLGEDVQIADEIYINGGRILPHKGISTCITEPEIVM